jgi:hypothetical protein
MVLWAGARCDPLAEDVSRWRSSVAEASCLSGVLVVARIQAGSLCYFERRRRAIRWQKTSADGVSSVAEASCLSGVLVVGREYRLEAYGTLGGGDVRSAGRKRQPMAEQCSIGILPVGRVGGGANTGWKPVADPSPALGSLEAKCTDMQIGAPNYWLIGQRNSQSNSLSAYLSSLSHRRTA